MDLYKLKNSKKIFLSISITAIFTILWSFCINSTQAAGPPSSFPGGHRGQEAINHLGDRLPEVASRYGLTVAKLKATFLQNADLHIDPSDNLVYFCGFGLLEGSTLADNSSSTPLNGPYPSDQTFQLHSLPGASKVIYLDFDGHTTSGTYWNGWPSGFTENIVSSPYDLI
jgi:hypothetical protein